MYLERLHTYVWDNLPATPNDTPQGYYTVSWLVEFVGLQANYIPVAQEDTEYQLEVKWGEDPMLDNWFRSNGIFPGSFALPEEVVNMKVPKWVSIGNPNDDDDRDAYHPYMEGAWAFKSDARRMLEEYIESIGL